ncbi:MAG: site-specific DNA-methyltransferase [Sterolibacterium sp.]
MSEYDAQKDAHDSYYAAIEAKRLRGDANPIKREVVIGDCRLLLGDCLEILPTLGRVDAVDFPDAVVYTQAYEKSAERQHRSPTRSDENMGTSQGRNLGAVCERYEISTGDGGRIRGDIGRVSEGAEADGNTIQVSRQAGSGEWALQARAGSAHLSDDGGEGSLRPVRCDGEPLHPSQGRGPLQQHAEQPGSDVHELPQFDAQAGVVELPKGWAILTDPPYGIGADKNLRANKKHGKAAAPSKDYGAKEWDRRAPDMSWAVFAGVPAIIWGGNYFRLPPNAGWLVWDKENGNNGYADCELAWTNLPQAVRRVKWRWAGMLQQDMANKEERLHPTQKPIQVMQWCLGFLPNAQTILDPFMGSGTTGVACVKLGRSFIGIEIDEGYFDIACDRIRKAYAQPDMFIDQPKAPEPKQEAMQL